MLTDINMMISGLMSNSQIKFSPRIFCHIQVTNIIKHAVYTSACIVIALSQRSILISDDKCTIVAINT